MNQGQKVSSHERDERWAPDELWAIVLAGGEGTRLASVTRLLCGRETPKQYVALDGTRTLLQRTMDRLGSLVPPHRTVVVVARAHGELAESQLAQYAGVHLVSQPHNAGTGPGLLLPLSLIKARCPDATVIVTPADHHLPNRGAFLSSVRAAAEVASHAPAGLALLGADAEGPATDLGWIVPREAAATDLVGDQTVDLVDRFVEKPPLPVAKRLFRDGGLLNTLVIVGSVEAFWRQAREHMPRQTGLFAEYVDALARRRESEAGDAQAEAEVDVVLDRVYRAMPAADLSRALLQAARGLAVVRLKDSGWCDCGTPERLLSCLEGTDARHHRQLRDMILGALHDRPVNTAS
jgi:mannose-1-phosphate guanylyltransferase